MPCYDYLGSRIQNDLSWSSNIQKHTAKAMRNMYGLRKLREFKVSKQLLKLFYSSTIESVMTFGISVWGGSIAKREKRAINRVRRCASRIVGESLEHWDKLYHSRATQLASKIMADDSHPLHSCFIKLPSGKRLRQPMARTKRYRDSFVPNAVAILNK